MAKVINGNLVDALLNGEVDYIMHCCNTHAKMGAGIAKEIKQRIPQAYQADVDSHNWWNEMCNGNYEQARNEQVGDVSLGAGVFNLYAQRDYGRGKQVDYGALAYAVLSAIEKLEDGVVIGAPYQMASGLAGGDWAVVREIVEGVFKAHDGAELVWYKL